ncbi:MAG: radical SAM protein [Elusimicrobia bacterium]|nr:radical SAM protein [Elusimicrobiota bacterium]
MKAREASDHFRDGLGYEKAADYGRALGSFRAALSGGYDNEHIHMAMGRVYRETGEYGASVSEFKKAGDAHRDKNDVFFSNEVLNETEISEKKLTLESRPRGLGAVLTTRCNLRCIMCSSWKKQWDIPGRAVSDIHGILPYLKRVMWLGGEVFLSKHFEGLFDAAARNLRLHQTVVTDGLLIDRKWAEKLARANMNLTYSIDGIDRNTYENIRRGADYDDLKRSARLINEEKEKSRNSMPEGRRMTTSINYVVMKSNYKEITDAVEFAKEYGFDDLTLTPVDYIDGEENIFLTGDRAAADHIREAVVRISARAGEYGLTFHNWLPAMGGAGHGGESGKTAAKKTAAADIFCYWPWQHLFIDIGGQVKPHCLCSRKVGNIEEDSLSGIWNSEAMINYRKSILEKKMAGLCNNICLSSPITRDCMGLSI